MKYGLRLFTQQVEWLGDKGVPFDCWDPRVKLYELHCYGQQWNIDRIFHT
jgi:hypothetical protein